MTTMRSKEWLHGCQEATTPPLHTISWMFSPHHTPAFLPIKSGPKFLPIPPKPLHLAIEVPLHLAIEVWEKVLLGAALASVTFFKKIFYTAYRHQRFRYRFIGPDRHCHDNMSGTHNTRLSRTGRKAGKKERSQTVHTEDGSSSHCDPLDEFRASLLEPPKLLPEPYVLTR